MPSLKQIDKIIDDGISLKTIAQAYSEISSAKLTKIRGVMENNISFAKELGEVYRVVTVEAAKRKLTLTPKIPGVAHLLITSNFHFYGNLEKNLVQYFSTSTESLNNSHPKTPMIRIIIGKTGETLLKSSRYSLDYKAYLLKKDLPDAAEFKFLLSLIQRYQTILIYHSRFKNVLTQIPVVSDISQSILQLPETDKTIDYIFEPEIQEILNFFEGQIIQILLEQTFLESELARTAARLISMDQAEMNAEKYLKNQRKILASTKRSIQNNRLLETISTFSNWREAR